MFSSVFWNANTYLSKMFYTNISESQTYSKYYHCQANIPILCLHAIYLLVLVLYRVSLCNCQHLELPISYRLQSNLSKRFSHAALICFHFRILLVQSKHNNIKATFCSTMPSSCCATLN